MFKSICWLITTILGWKQPLKIGTRAVHKRTIIIYPHSSYFDYFYFLLLSYADTSMQHYDYDHMYCIMTERFSWIFLTSKNIISVPDRFIRYYMETYHMSYLNAVVTYFTTKFLSIFSSKVKVHAFDNTEKYDTIQTVYSQLKNKSQFGLLLSPVTNMEWKPEYKVLAEKLKCSITVAGVDYARKRLVLFDSMHYSKFNESSLKFDFEDIGTARNNTFIDYPTLSSLIGSAIMCPMMFKISYILGFWSVIMSFVSFWYHYTTEECFESLDVMCSKISLTLLLIYAWLNYHPLTIVNLLCFSAALFFLGKSWHCSKPRRNGYDINHSFFHLFISMACYMLLNY